MTYYLHTSKLFELLLLLLIGVLKHNSGRSILHCCWSRSVERNNLPRHLCDFELSLSEFRQLLKMHFVWLKIVAPSHLLLDVVHLTNVLLTLRALNSDENMGDSI